MAQQYMTRRPVTEPSDRAPSSPAKKSAGGGGASLQALMSGSPSAGESLGRRIDLPDAIRSKMESSFGADFSRVELYESKAVAETGAQAMTMGNKIGFAPGKLDFRSTAGQSLLGHELSHVVHQARGSVRGAGLLADSVLESRADREGEMAASGKAVYTGAAPSLSAHAVASASGPMQAKGAPGFVRKHRRAVDFLNNNRADYDNMSRWEKFKWSVKNPLARMSASGKKADTRARNTREAELQALVNRDKASYAGGANMGDAYFDHSTLNVADDGVSGLPGKHVDRAQSVVGNEALSTVLGEASNYTGMVSSMNSDKAKALTTALAQGKAGVTQSQIDEAKALSGKTGMAGGIIGGFGGMFDGVSNAMTADIKRKQGDRVSAATSGLRSAASFGGGIGSFIGAAGITVPGLDIATGGLNMIADTTDLVSDGMIRGKMSKRMAALKGTGNAVKDEDKTRYNTLNQARRMARTRQIKSGTSLAGNALKVTGGALSLGGITAPIGAVLSTVGTGVGLIGGLASKRAAKTVRKKTVNEELDLDKKIEALQAKYKTDNPNGKELSKREAKHVVLQSMGFESGKRKEAFQNITMNRASQLQRNATAGSEEEGILRDMHLHRTKDGKFSLQAVAERLGMESGDWRKQMEKTKRSRKNPFVRTP